MVVRNKANEPGLSYYLPIARWKIIWFISYLKLLVLSTNVYIYIYIYIYIDIYIYIYMCVWIYINSDIRFHNYIYIYIYIYIYRERERERDWTLGLMKALERNCHNAPLVLCLQSKTRIYIGSLSNYKMYIYIYIYIYIRKLETNWELLKK